MKSVTASAPGKLMILGEHAVVYGFPCIVAAVDKKITVSVEPMFSSDNIQIPLGTDSQFVEKTLSFFRKKYDISYPVSILTHGEFTKDVGLGSSSAVTVATIKALSVFFDLKLSNKELFDLSYQVVLDIQGKGSGFDIAAAVWGGVLYFKKGGEIIDNLSLDTLPLIVGYCGEKAQTTQIINQVFERYEKNKQNIDNLFNHIGKLVDRGKDALCESDYEELGKIMIENHKLLQVLGVSTKKLDDMVDVAIGAGAWGAKLSGAGGGDCMIALADKYFQENVKKAIRDVGGEIIDCTISKEGVVLL